MIRERFRRPSGAIAAVILVGVIVSACSSASPSQPSSPAAFSAAASVAASQPVSMATSTSTEESAQATASETPGTEPTDNLNPFACGEPVNGVGNTARAQITDVRIGTHDGYDRIVLEFAGGVPQFSVEPATPPFTQDASGLPIDVAGSSFLRIRLNGGTKVSPEGGVTYSGPTDFQPDYPALVQLIEGGDFEAVSTWYVGLATSQACFRVLTLADAPRIVVDLQD